jgi:hypothetical protein
MIKRIDLVLDTYLKDEAILELVNEYLGDLILHNVENLKSETKEDAVKEMTGL